MRFYGLWIFTFALALLAYLPGITGGFLFDDTSNLTLNEALKTARPTWESLWQVMRSGDAGPLKRPLSMASFAVNVWLAGMNPVFFKLTNIFIHLVNGWLLYCLTRQLLAALREAQGAPPSPARARWIALAVTALWLLAPLQLTSVLYTVQRMTSLAATFALLGMLGYTTGRRRWLKTSDGAGGAAILAGVFCTAPAALAKENGLLLPVFLFLIEWLIFGFRAASKPAQTWLKLGHALGVGLPVAGAAIWQLGLRFSELVGGYALRDFTLAERVLTEPRILWWYVRWLLVPDIREMGLFHDDIPLSRGLWDPPTTALAILEWILVVGLALWLGARRKAAVFAFGVLFFLAGHSLESTVFPLEIVHEHRNYLPSWGIFLILGYYLLHPEFGQVLARLRGQIPEQESWLGLRVLVLAGFGALSAAATWARALSWSDQRTLVIAEATHHPKSARASFSAARVMIELSERYGRNSEEAKELRELARTLYRHANRFDDYYLVGRFGLLTLDALDGKPVDTGLLEELQARLRTGPVAANQVFTLTRLLEDQLKDRWNLPAEALLAAVDALLENPRLTGSWRKDLLIAALPVAFRHQAYAQAVRYAREQVALDENDPAFRLNLAQALFLVGDRDGAAKQMEEAERLDPQGRLGKMRQVIAEHMAQSLRERR
ncbi:hypothetical protein JCM13664_08250 [Methylothermus subterraneus]